MMNVRECRAKFNGGKRINFRVKTLFSMENDYHRVGLTWKLKIEMMNTRSDSLALPQI
jgi:hypothetical protein